MINAPVITSLSGVYGSTWADRWDINGVFTWDATDQTIGDTEIWIRRVFVDADFSKWGTVGFAARAFTIGHLCAASADPIHYQVKLRFNNYTDPAGPFSAIIDVELNDPDVFGVIKETGVGLALHEQGYDVPIFSITFGEADERQLQDIARISGGKVFDGRKDMAKAFRDAKGYN